jgi:drug/metabolite transporter (DMT)-like permease
MLKLRLRPADLARLAGLALCGLSGMTVLLFYGLQHTTAINSSMLMQLSPILIMIMGLGIGERITWHNLAAMLLSLFGTMLTVGFITQAGLNMSMSGARGNLLVLGSATCWALYAVLSKSTVQRLGGFTATTWVMLLGAAELMALRLALPAEFNPPVDVGSWAVIIYMAIFPTALAFYAWYEALRLIDLTILNIMQYLTPVFTILLAWWLLGERLTWLQGLGIVIVLSGVAMLRPASAKK